MNDTRRKVIALLPDNAPDTAVIAAWAGLPPWQDHGTCTKGHERTNTCGTWRPAANERTLRRWLLDGGVALAEFKNHDLYWQTISPEGSDSHKGASKDSPDKAFIYAYNEFAGALRKDAKS